MATASVTNSFSSATTISSSQVNTNFSDLVSFLNGSVLHLDGSKTMSGDLAMGSNAISGATTGVFSGLITGATSWVKVAQTSAQTIADTTWTDVTWSSVVVDDPDTYWAGGAPTVLTMPRTGIYLVLATTALNAHAGTLSGMRIVDSAATVHAETNQSGVHTAMTTASVVSLASGATVKVAVYQNSGGNVDTTGTASYMNFAAIYLGS